MNHEPIARPPSRLISLSEFIRLVFTRGGVAVDFSHAMFTRAEAATAACRPTWQPGLTYSACQTWPNTVLTCCSL